MSVGICVITQIDPPTAPTTSDSTYIVFATAKTITLTPQFEQVPACGYTLTGTPAWTIPATAPITESGSDPYVLTVTSTDGLAHHAVNPLIVQLDATYQGSSWSANLAFDVTITDPCRTSTITSITLVQMSVVLGVEGLQNFAEAIDSAGTTYGAAVCGTRTYELV